MAVTSRDAVIATAPELSDVAANDARWATFIADAEAEMDPAVWGTWLERGARHLVAHWLTLSKMAGSGRGFIQSETVGGVSRTYAATAALGEYVSTAYGAEYRRMVRIVGGGPR